MLHNDPQVRAATAPLLSAYVQTTATGSGTGSATGSGTAASPVLCTLFGWVEGWADALVVGVGARLTGTKGGSASLSPNPGVGADDDLAGIGRRTV